MARNTAAMTRRLSDPDFQGKIVERGLQLNILFAVLLIVVLGLLVRSWGMRPAPLYFFVDGAGAPRPAVALTSPILGPEDFLSWAVRWTLKPYNINYHDFPTQLNQAGAHFLPSGWNTFAQAFVSQGNLAKLKDAKLLCYAQPTRAATIRNQSVVGGHKQYVVQFPFIQTCENVNQQNTQTLLATVTIDRVDDADHPDGLAISQLIASPL